MSFYPMTKMWERIEIARTDSASSMFMALMYAWEMLFKCLVVGMVSAIEDDKQRNQYNFLYRLVRADGLGEWCEILDEILTGPTAQYLIVSNATLSEQLITRVGRGSWQYDAYEKTCNCLEKIDELNEGRLAKVDGRKVFKNFVILRNKTRAHGAFAPGKCESVCKDLEEGLKLLESNLSIFSMTWAYLHQGLSGKYRISPIAGDTNSLDYLKKSSSGELPIFEDGVYICFSKLRKVELLNSDVDLFDFYLPNGQFTDKKFEFLSYISGNKIDGDSSFFLNPAQKLPDSETQGLSEMDSIGEVFTNVPPMSEDYINRNDLEEKLKRALLNENHPIVTLKGSGGTGKTWLTLRVVNNLCKLEKPPFNVIYWFSARDIDLLSDGPKKVRPNILDENDVAKEFAKLLKPSKPISKTYPYSEFLAENLSKSNLGPALYIFDNFETVKNPAEFYFWLDTYIRYPNKILITTRVRDFKADFDVSVGGMSEEESEELIKANAKKLGIYPLITKEYRQQLIQEAEGHPYVLKILLGEVAKAGKLVKVERIIANKDEILKALFERTYNKLSQPAKRVFLTLCNWHSFIPQIALEAILLRPENDRMDVLGAVDELEKSSFIEVNRSNEDEEFLSVPLVTQLFGKKKLLVSPFKSAIESDTELLRVFGATNSTEIRSGIEPRISRLFKNIAEQINRDSSLFQTYLPILEKIAYKLPKTWLSIALLYQEFTEREVYLEKASEAITLFIENVTSDEDKRSGWRLLSTINQKRADWLGEIHALVEAAILPDTDFNEISNAANRINQLLKDRISLDSEEKKILGGKLLDVMEKRVVVEGNGTDYSRMVWLARNIGLHKKATEYIEMGLKIDPENDYIVGLAMSEGLI